MGDKMTPERAKELLPIIQAFAEGKTIQAMLNGAWLDILREPSFENPAVKYRIKPEEEICKGCGRPLSEHTDKNDDVKFPDELSHEDILKMWWRRKEDTHPDDIRWVRIFCYYPKADKRYGVSLDGDTYVYTAEELLNDWEYAEVPPEK